MQLTRVSLREFTIKQNPKTQLWDVIELWEHGQTWPDYPTREKAMEAELAHAFYQGWYITLV